MNDSYKGKFAAVLPAGGIGKRMGGSIPKQLMELEGKPVYFYSLMTFLALEEIAEVVLVVPADWKDYFEKQIYGNGENGIGKCLGTDLDKLKIVTGGAERWQSVRNGVEALSGTAEYVLVHDVARPLISKEIIKNVCRTLVEKGSCLVAKPAIDTIKVVEGDKVQQTLDRKKIWMAQTPQAASIPLLKSLYSRIDREPLGFTPTDEASILEFFGETVFIVQGNAMNDKLTTPEDFEAFSMRLAAK